jgi:hypothetical protein
MVRKYISSFLTLTLAATTLLPEIACAARPIVKAGPGVAMQAKSSSSAQAPTLPPGYYGLHLLHLQYGAAWPSIKFGTWRLWDAGVDWRDMQPKAGVYNWQTLDAYVALAQQQGIDLLLELGQTPQWASARPNEAAATGNGAAAEPTSNALWTAYVTAVATRYKGKIAFYEVWNEVNGINYWTGTSSEMVQLTALASKTIKSIDPNAKIISPSLSGAAPAQLAYLKSMLDVGLGPSVDIFAAHFYVLGQTPEAILPEAQNMQALLTQYNQGSKPIFNTEFGWAAPTTFNNADDQSGYLMRSMLVGWGAGFGRFMWYAWDNSNWVTVTMTLPDFKTPTPPAKAYVTLEGWTQGKEVSRCAPTTPATTWTCDITDLSGDHSRIYWSTSGNAIVTPSLTWKPAHAVDMYGNVTAYTGGALTIGAHPLLIKE